MEGDLNEEWSKEAKEIKERANALIQKVLQ